MKIAIHDSKNSFSDKWIKYCNEKNINYKIVNCYNNDIISQLTDCDALMWHFHHSNPKDFLFAKQLLYSVEAMGKIVFPDYKTVWHFDDKVGQKYLLEAIGAPFVNSYVFYSKEDAFGWAKKADFPKVFKLRRGAGSSNVRIVKTKSEAIRLIKKAFAGGFSNYAAMANLKERIRKFKKGQTDLFDVMKGVVRLFYSTKYANVVGKENGYIYFQDFIPENNFDIRVIVIDQKAFAIKRMVRENDFRASGSGILKYEKENFNEETIAKSFQICEKIKAQCVALDFIYLNNNPLVVEISYGFLKEAYDNCVGFWDSSLNFHEGSFNSQEWMVDQIVNALVKRETMIN